MASMMNKSAGQPSNKSIIAKDKLSDEDFDQLVIDTSHKFAQDSARLDLLDCSSPDSSSSSLIKPGQIEALNGGTCDSADKTMSEYNRLNQPKRPMNAFMVWSQAIRRELHHRFSNVQNATLSKALGRVWRSLGSEEKEPYVRKANLIKANHKREYPNYRYQPRRIHERRTRCNMLIGINLNHPVSQYPLKQAPFGNFTDEISRTSSQSVAQAQICQLNVKQPYHNQSSQPTIELNNGIDASNHMSRLGRNFFHDNERQLEERKRMRKQVEMAAQTFDYQPHQMMQVEHHNECRSYSGNNVASRQNDHYHDQQCSSYSQFKVFATESHQQHYQHQGIPYEFGAYNNGYLDGYNSQATGSMGYYTTTDVRERGIYTETI